MIDEIVVEEKNGIKKIAELENGDLKEIIFWDDNKINEGNIYLGKITKKINTANGKEGYFINVGYEKDAFINAQEHDLEDLKANEGQDVIVQVIQEQRAEKGARMSRFLQIAGITMVYCPYGSEIEISSKIEEEAKREELYNIVAQNCDNGGWIIRTAAENSPKEFVLDEMQELQKKFNMIISKAKSSKAPCLLLSKDNVLQEIVAKNIDNIQKLVTNNHLIEKDFEEILPTEYTTEPFKKYGIDEMINDALKKVIKLKCGGRIIVEETKACVAIDVDSGEGVSQGGLGRLNQEAAYEIAKQIILRNLSGKIIIDFAGMAEFKFLKSCIDIMEKELRDDTSHAKVLGISKAGNVEIVRMRKRPTLCDLLTEECKTCCGTGRVEK